MLYAIKKSKPRTAAKAVLNFIGLNGLYNLNFKQPNDLKEIKHYMSLNNINFWKAQMSNPLNWITKEK